jgi:hypothetical protein
MRIDQKLAIWIGVVRFDRKAPEMQLADGLGRQAGNVKIRVVFEVMRAEIDVTDITEETAAGANSSGGRNALMEGVAMKLRKRRSDRSGRPPLYSLGRPAAAGRDERRRYWAGIAIGLESGDAALAAGVPPAVGNERADARKVRAVDAARTTNRNADSMNGDRIMTREICQQLRGMRVREEILRMNL